MGRVSWLMAMVAVWVALMSSNPGAVWAQDKLLRVYGPGGPLAPMEECAQLFARKHGVEIKVVAGPEAKWIAQALQDADIIFGGAEYMLTDFMLRHPGLIDPRTRVSLWVRPAGILVRKGNPRKIKSLADLGREGVRLLDVNGAGQLGLWEDLAGVRGLIPQIQKNIVVSVSNTAEAIDRWKAMPELDAWITYESWHLRLREHTDLVRLPEKERLYRGTPVAVTAISRQRDLALRFIDFLKTEEAHRIFRKWGWK